jgi:glutamyl-tRNA synthetase
VTPVRVRFAPSPTGYFHVGSARSTLFNWVFARQHADGVFLLRIEDTDTERNRPEWTQGILDAIRWLGCDWDEGPFFQSERSELYASAAQRLFDAGQAYYCDQTPEQIQERAKANGRQGYDGYSRDRGLGPGPGRVLRFRTPDTGTTIVHDLVRGDVEFENALLEDFVIQRSNGTAMFLLANVIDDIDMRITHVMRAEEHLPNTPKAICLWHALTDAAEPTWAHIPLLVNEQRKKLSKRRDPVALEMYREQGYLAEAMVNYLMTLGWSPKDDREIVSMPEIIDEFDIGAVLSSPAFFDVKKLTSFNATYIRALPVDEFIERCQPWVTGPDTPWSADQFDAAVFARMAPLLQTRVERLGDVVGQVDFLFLDDLTLDEAAWAKASANASLLPEVISQFESIEWTADAINHVVVSVGEAHGLKVSKAQAPVRVAVTGKSVGPPLWESLEVLGRERTLARLRAAVG